MEYKEYNFDDPYFVKMFREQIKKMIQEELNNINYLKWYPATVSATPITGYADIYLNTSTASTPTIISNVKLRNNLTVNPNDKIVILGDSLNNIIIDINKSS